MPYKVRLIDGFKRDLLNFRWQNFSYYLDDTYCI